MNKVLLTVVRNKVLGKILWKNPGDFFSPYLTLADEPTANLNLYFKSWIFCID